MREKESREFENRYTHQLVIGRAPAPLLDDVSREYLATSGRNRECAWSWAFSGTEVVLRIPVGIVEFEGEDP